MNICAYLKKYRKLLLMSVIAVGICYGFLAFSGNIRIDTEELINVPGAKLGWLTIGRFGLAFLKDALGLATHSTLKSGILFFMFFLLGANLLTFSMWKFSQKRDYPYWIFLMLYVTSNIWSYQIYFSVQQAEVACAMFLLVVAAICAVQACFEKSGIARVWRLLVAMALLVLGLGAYQALAVYYVAVCLVLFLAWMEGQKAEMAEPDTQTETESAREKSGRRVICGIAGLLISFGVAYVIYTVIAKTWFMTTADYMGDQMGWGHYPATDCIKNVLRTAKNLVLSIGPRNFSFYTAGVLLTGMALIAEWRRYRKDGRKLDLQAGVKVLAIIGLAASPFLMTLYMGEMLVTRSQFALPVAAAFLGMYGIDGLHKQTITAEGEAETADAKEGGKRRIMSFLAKVGTVCAVLAIVWQCIYNLRLTYTDNQRFASDAAKTEQLVENLCEANGGELPAQPIVFVGYQEAELPDACRRTEMYGWSFYGWDYSEENPTGATHRIVGFVQAYSGVKLNESTSEEQRQLALELAEQLSDFPSDGSIAVTDELVVVRLSEVCAPQETDWW